MYCSIKDFKNYEFLGDTSLVKENIINYVNDIEFLLKKSKEIDTLVIKLPYYEELSKSDLDNLNLLCSGRKNVKIMVRDKLIEGLPCFFQFGNMNAENLDRLQTLGEMGVTDAYISGELAFNIKKAKKKAQEFGMKIRVVPNMVQAGGIGFTLVKKEENINSFWIKPGDLDLYEDFIDVIEFVGESEKQHLFYKIYFIDKRWNTNLAIVIAGLEDVYGVNIPKEFTKARLNCGKKCLESKCHTCFKFKALSNLATENQIEIEELEESLD